MTKEITDKPKNTIRGLIESDAFKGQIARALPAHLTPDRFIRITLTALTKQPKLAQCEQASLFGALLTLSQLGLEPDGRNAHLIPFENRKRGVVECQLLIDYKGLVELVMRSGLVSNIHADVVCENDDFIYDKGEIKKHLINFKQPRGKVYAAYALCRFKDGTEKCEVMNKEEIEMIRGRSKAGQSGPWVTDWNEMSKKTVFRRLSKWLPFSPEQHAALAADDSQFDHAVERAVVVNPVASSGESKLDQIAKRYDKAAAEPEIVVDEAPVFGSYEYVHHKISHASDIDGLNEALDMAKEFTAEEQNKLIEIYNAKEKELS